MQKTKIEWCDATWNPVTGCRHHCPYCYARRQAQRFSGYEPCYSPGLTYCDGNYDLAESERKYRLTSGSDGKPRKKVVAPYPFGFEPTIHRYKLNQPQKWKEPEDIFVCSMADLFGKWVPDEWIEAVFAACEKAPQHRYLFLTKNPTRYMELAKAGKLPEEENFWYGSTTATPSMPFWRSEYHNTFVSIEPLLKPFPPGGVRLVKKVGWVILGAESGNRKNKVTPEKEWIENIVQQAQQAKVPVFMKDSLIPIIGEENMRREFPWKGV